jgi:O-antigen/teichoic acid export membrane protein
MMLSVVSLRGYGRVRPTFSLREIESLIASGVRATPAFFATQGVYRVDRYFLGAFRGVKSVGIYAIASSAAEMVRVVSYGVYQVLFFRQASGRASAREVNIARIATVLSTALICGVLAWLAPFLIVHLVGHRYDAAVTPLRILLLAEVLLASFLTDTSTLLTRAAYGLAFWAAAAGLVAALVADIILISRYGAIGAAWASVASYAVLALTTRLAARRLRSAVVG